MKAKYIDFKNISDITFAFLMFVLLLPFLMLISFMILIFDGNPIFFIQYRVGIKGKIFRIFKFRTMKKNDNSNFNGEVLNLNNKDLAEARFKFKTVVTNDKRITNLGKILRKFHIDEIPQLINILKGDMSFVGPRPDTPVQKNDYKPKEWHERISVKPGITGWAQTMHGYAADEIQTRRKLEYDFFYIKNISPWLDFVICMRTFKILVLGHGAR